MCWAHPILFVPAKIYTKESSSTSVTIDITIDQTKKHFKYKFNDAESFIFF